MSLITRHLGLEICGNEDGDLMCFNEKMLKDNFVITVDIGTLPCDCGDEDCENGEEEQMISVHHLRKVGGVITDAVSYGVYWDKSLVPIQLHTLLKELSTLHAMSESQSEFEEALDSISIHKMSSSMQRDLEHGQDVLARVKSAIDVATKLSIKKKGA